MAVINLDGTRKEFVTPGSAVRQVSALRHVTDCATRPSWIGIYRTYTVFINLSISFHFCVVLRDLYHRIGQLHFIVL